MENNIKGGALGSTILKRRGNYLLDYWGKKLSQSLVIGGNYLSIIFSQSLQIGGNYLSIIFSQSSGIGGKFPK
jgi:hypothetical protein